MKNIEQILKEAGIEVTDEQKAAVNAAVTENYKTIAEFEKQAKKLTAVEADRDNYKGQLDTANETLEKFKDIDPEKQAEEIQKYKQAAKEAQDMAAKQILERDQRDYLKGEFDKLKIWPDVTKYDRLHRLFQMAQDSDFLSGRNGRWGGCSFDWLINKTNALKVLEGTYANKGGENNARSNTNNTGAGNAGNNNRADPGTVEGTTSEALARFRRNSGI